MRLVARQGDVLVFAAKKSAKRRGPKIPPTDRGVVLALGERTGHAHTIEAEVASLYAASGPECLDGDRVLDLARDAFLRHTVPGGGQADHGPVALPKGRYVVRIKRVYTPEEIRRVED